MTNLIEVKRKDKAQRAHTCQNPKKQAGRQASWQTKFKFWWFLKFYVLVFNAIFDVRWTTIIPKGNIYHIRRL